MGSTAYLDSIFPTLFSKTFFILSAQIFITWLTTHFVFLFFKKIDPKLENNSGNEDVFQTVVEDTAPEYRWVFSKLFFYSIIAAWFVLFLIMEFWGMHQSLAVSFALFSLWSFLTGVELEYVLFQVAEGLGRKVLALTATIVFGAYLVGVYSHVNFGFLQLPLFIALSILILINLFQLFRSMDELKQRIMAGLGAVIFTLYLVYDFNLLIRKENVIKGTWPNAMHFAIKIYLDIINLFLQLLRLMSKHHH